jgi:hypothetical protein
VKHLANIIKKMPERMTAHTWHLHLQEASVNIGQDYYSEHIIGLTYCIQTGAFASQDVNLPVPKKDINQPIL